MTDFNRLQSTDDIEPLLERSNQSPVFIFKHSLVCPISTAAYNEWNSFVDSHAGEADFNLIEIQNARDVSRAVAERVGVRHESPQAILLRNGEVAWHASHRSIRVASLTTALEGAVAGSEAVAPG